jgi:DNA-binding MarR family transcriptional regulator
LACRVRLRSRLRGELPQQLGKRDIMAAMKIVAKTFGEREARFNQISAGLLSWLHVSHNFQKLVETGFLDHQRSLVDRRSVRIKLTDKGREVRDIVEALCQKHISTIEQVGGINPDELAALNKWLYRLERFWTDQILYRL